MIVQVPLHSNSRQLGWEQRIRQTSMDTQHRRPGTGDLESTQGCTSSTQYVTWLDWGPQVSPLPPIHPPSSECLGQIQSRIRGDSQWLRMHALICIVCPFDNLTGRIVPNTNRIIWYVLSPGRMVPETIFVKLLKTWDVEQGVERSPEVPFVTGISWIGEDCVQHVMSHLRRRLRISCQHKNYIRLTLPAILQFKGSLRSSYDSQESSTTSYEPANPASSLLAGPTKTICEKYSIKSCRVKTREHLRWERTRHTRFGKSPSSRRILHD